MKAHIRTPRPFVLCYGLQDTNSLAALCQKSGYDFSIAAPKDLSIALGKLCGVPGSYRQGPVPQRTDFMPALFFSDFSNTQLDKMLDDLKQHQITVPLKAVLTASNRIWPLFEVLQELEQEHAAFQNGSKP